MAARQRAHRSYTDEAVSDDVIAQLLAIAVRAPSAENSQPWEFVVVRDVSTRTAFSEMMERAFDNGGKQWSQSRMPEALFADVEQTRRRGIRAK